MLSSQSPPSLTAGYTADGPLEEKKDPQEAALQQADSQRT